MLYASSNVVAAVIPYFFKGEAVCIEIQTHATAPAVELAEIFYFLFHNLVFFFVYACKDSKDIFTLQVFK